MERRGWLFESDNLFHSDRAAEGPLPPQALIDFARLPSQELTFTCAPPDSGIRMGIDRDEDGILDGDDPDSGGI